MTEQSLLTDAYWKRAEKIQGEGRTQKETYEVIEAEVEEKYGINRYSSYESFRVNRHRHLKSKKREGYTLHEYE